MHSSIRMMRKALPSTSGTCATVNKASEQLFQAQPHRKLVKRIQGSTTHSPINGVCIQLSISIRHRIYKCMVDETSHQIFFLPRKAQIATQRPSYSDPFCAHIIPTLFRWLRAHPKHSPLWQHACASVGQ